MESILRPIVIYLFLLVIFRLAGRRSLSEITTFDFVLLLLSASRRNRLCWATTSR